MKINLRPASKEPMIGEDGQTFTDKIDEVKNSSDIDNI